MIIIIIIGSCQKIEKDGEDEGDSDTNYTLRACQETGGLEIRSETIETTLGIIKEIWRALLSRRLFQ